VIEVKTRTSDAFGSPIEAIGARKRQALIAAAAEYRVLTEWRGPIRYAVVGLTLNRDGAFDADLFEDPFD
jgi:putative endonuclease